MDLHRDSPIDTNEGLSPDDGIFQLHAFTHVSARQNYGSTQRCLAVDECVASEHHVGSESSGFMYSASATRENRAALDCTPGPC